MREYHWTAWFHGADGVLLLVKDGVLESEDSRHDLEHQIRRMVAEKYDVADADSISVRIDG